MEVVEQRLAVRVDLARERLEGCTELLVCRRRDGFHAALATASISAQNLQKTATKDKVPSADSANGKPTTNAGNSSSASATSTLGSSKFQTSQTDDWDSSKKLVMNCRQCSIENIYVNGVSARWKLHEFMKKIVVEGNVRDLKTFYAFMTENLLASKDGELSIEIPASEISKDRLTVRIEYHLERPKAGLRFSGCGPHNAEGKWSYERGSNDKKHHSYVYSYSSMCSAETLGAACGARCWFPCVDTLQAKYPFELEVTAPLGLTVIASGERVETIVNEANSEQTVRFVHNDPIAPYNIGFCVGPFVERPAPNAEWIRIYHFPDAASKTALRKVTANLKAALVHMIRYFGVDKFPYPTYSQVFIAQEDAFADVVPFASMAFISEGILRTERSPTPDSSAGAGLMFGKHLHYEQARGAAYSFFGGRVGPKSEGDVWLVAGLAGLLAYRYAEATWKQAEYTPPQPTKQGNKMVKPRVPPMNPPLASKAREEHVFVGSTDPRELLTQPFTRMKQAKRRHEAVLQWHGPSGNVLQRPLQRPSPVSDPVNSCLWAARGIDFDCLLSQRATTTIHMLDKAANMGGLEEDDLGRDDPFAGVLRHYLTTALEEDAQHREWVRHGTIPTVEYARPVTSEFGDVDLGDDLQRQLNREYGSTGITEYDFLLHMCRISAFKPADFRAGDKDNFAAYWLRRCTFIELRAAVEYKSGTNELEFMFAQRGDDRLQAVKFPLAIRVVEEDDTWQYEKRITKGTARDPQKETIAMHTSRQRQRGGRKARTEKERINKWENPATLTTKELLTLMGLEGDDRVWHNENPVKYVVLDPEFIWPRQIAWRQSEIMNLELLSDSSLSKDVLAQTQALRDLSLSRSATDHLVSRPGGQSQSGGGSGTAAGTASTTTGASGGGESSSSMSAEAAFDLRNLCAISACILDYQRPARVRAEAMLSLAEWQSQHAPKVAYQPQYANLQLEQQPGSHPWVALNLALLAIRKMFFHPKTGKLLPNDFGVPGEYAMKRATVRSLARMRACSLKPPDEVCDLILTFLRDNDNSINNYDDGDYLKDLMVAAAEVVVNFVAGTYNEEEKAGSDVAENIGSRRTIRQVLGKYYEIIDHIHRYLHYDAIEPSTQHAVTVGCLRALSLLEAEGILEASTPYFAYAVFKAPVRPENKAAAVVAAHDWGPNVREEAFKAIVVAYVNQRGRPSIFKASAAVDCNIEWLHVVKWIIDSVVADPCPQLRWNVVKFMLKMHADTIMRTYPELADHNSPSGLFYPLSDAPGDIDQRARVPTTDIVASLWVTINESTEYDGRMRLAWAQLWRAIWRLKTPPIVEHSMTTVSNLGNFLEGWSDDVEYFLQGARQKIHGNKMRNNKRPAGIGFNAFGGLPPPQLRSTNNGSQKRTTIKLKFRTQVLQADQLKY